MTVQDLIDKGAELRDKDDILKVNRFVSKHLTPVTQKQLELAHNHAMAKTLPLSDEGVSSEEAYKQYTQMQHHALVECLAHEVSEIGTMIRGMFKLPPISLTTEIDWS